MLFDHGVAEKLAEHLENVGADLLASTGFRKLIWRRTWSDKPDERHNREIRLWADVSGIFPKRQAIIRLVGVVLGRTA